MLNQAEQVKQDGIIAGTLNRRRFLQVAGVSAGAVGTLGLAGCGGLIGVDPEAGPAPSIEDVLNFALNLEYFEASFYSYITTGAGIPSANLGANPGTITGGAQVKFTDPNVAALATQLAADELAHVQFLRAGMSYFGLTPVDAPALNLAALGAPTDDASFLALARQLETVGTSAYEGGVQYLASNILAVEYAARIHSAEGQHEAALRQFCISKGITSPAVDKYDRPPVLGSNTIFNTSVVTGLNTARNASEVLQIVYAAPGMTGVLSGGFFPKGLNGNVKST
ncbi:ferritin-like domain-containing protein [Acidipila sp. EB88]|uniref:ferritin-like domain-containing protein n=1 Tax=Acidipila sp. EB88 TaxID=2305226 RepID=UPI0013155643|nr:ferritin-like domain-containing protein [Acidipila sp. EB88]